MVHQYQLDQLPVGASARAVAEIELAADLRRVTLLFNFCYFGGRFFKYTRGFLTGIASGRELAELYLHVVERQTLAAHAHELAYCRRYVDDLGAVINTDTAGVERFVADYRAALAVEGLEITVEISRESMTLLDQHMCKGEGWASTGRLDLSVYQKPLSAYLYIPSSSDHAPHILRAWI